MAVATAPFADVQDVAGIWRPLSDAERVVASNLIDEASRIILEVGAVALRIQSELVSAATLRDVCAHMVQRVMLNPERLRQFSVTVDDATRSGSYEAGVAGELTITPAEMNRLLGVAPAAASSGAFTIMNPALLRPSLPVDTVWPWP